jgi:hypothetical protein
VTARIDVGVASRSGEVRPNAPRSLGPTVDARTNFAASYDFFSVACLIDPRFQIT